MAKLCRLDILCRNQFAVHTGHDKAASLMTQIFINGQTGRIVGEPPVSIKKALAIFGGIAAGCTLIGELIWMVVNGL